MLAYSGWSFLTRWRSTSCIWSLQYLDHGFGFSWCAPWSREPGTPARDHAGHLRKEVFGVMFRRVDHLHLTPDGLQHGLARRKPQRVCSSPQTSSCRAEQKRQSHPASDEQVWQHLLETVLALTFRLLTGDRLVDGRLLSFCPCALRWVASA